MKHYFCCRSLGREEKVKRNVQSAFGVISAPTPYLVESYSNRSWHGLRRQVLGFGRRQYNYACLINDWASDGTGKGL